MDNCPICKGYRYTSTEHFCPPLFKIKDEEYLGDKLMEFYAESFEAAAIKYMRRRDSEHDLVGDSEGITITVIDPKGIEKVINITAEPDIYYSTTIL